VYLDKITRYQGEPTDFFIFTGTPIDRTNAAIE